MAAKKPSPSPDDKGHRPPRDPDHIFDRVGPRLRAELDQLQKSEAKILKALKKPETARAFAADPLATLTAIGVDVPPIVKARLKAAPVTGDMPDLLRKRAFRLPDGQVVTANVTVRFTGTPKGR